MSQPKTRAAVWAKRATSIGGLAVFLAGMHWLWQLRFVWPRTLSDHIQQPIQLALGVIILGLYLIFRSK